jgi:hypothetical protein
MTRTEVKTFIQAGINALNDGIAYGTGRISEFNSSRTLSYPHIWMEPLTAGTTLENNKLAFDEWKVKLNIAKKDKSDSDPEEYETIIDQCDLTAQELIQKYNQVVDGYKLVTISGINRTPFIKKHADCLSGVVLEFNISAPNTTNFC